MARVSRLPFQFIRELLEGYTQGRCMVCLKVHGWMDPHGGGANKESGIDGHTAAKAVSVILEERDKHLD